MLSGELVHERYRLEEMLGSGGMAEVWRAKDERLERFVAIKFPAENLVEDPEFMVRFFSEAQAVARLSHPHVVNVLDFGEHGGHSFLVMEYVSGGSLDDLTGEPVEPERARELIRQAALAAGAAHAAGIVHRDIKPANILVDEQGHVKLADFGIASTAVAERLTATGAAIGSPHYVSPEQATGNAATPQSDVYALGVVLYELLTGKRPIEADNIAAIAIAHVEREPVPPGHYVEGLDADTEAIVMRCLDKDPAARFSNGDELAAALQQRAAAKRALTAAIAQATLTEEIDEPLESAERNQPAWMLTAAIVAALLVAAGIAFALARPTEDASAGPGPAPTKSKSDKPRKRKPSPTATASTPAEVSIPSPAASRPPGEDTSDGSENDDDDSGQPRQTRKPPPRPRPTKPPRERPSPPASPESSPSA